MEDSRRVQIQRAFSLATEVLFVAKKFNSVNLRIVKLDGIGHILFTELLEALYVSPAKLDSAIWPENQKEEQINNSFFRFWVKIWLRIVGRETPLILEYGHVRMFPLDKDRFQRIANLLAKPINVVHEKADGQTVPFCLVRPIRANGEDGIGMTYSQIKRAFEDGGKRIIFYARASNSLAYCDITVTGLSEKIPACVFLRAIELAPKDFGMMFGYDGPNIDNFADLGVFDVNKNAFQFLSNKTQAIIDVVLAEERGRYTLKFTVEPTAAT